MRSFYTLDVFASAPLEGNPLAVVTDGEGLSDQRMQAIAREFNLSETVFVLPPSDPHHRARLRIFTPATELPFAGHPIVGTASLLKLLDGGPTADSAFGLEIGAGLVPCVVEKISEGAALARFRAPVTPSLRGDAESAERLAAALNLDLADLALDRHRPMRATSGGSVFQTVPLRSLDALAKARPTGDFDSCFGADLAYLYTRAADADQADWRVRMFAPNVGVPEDPATGSAAASFAAVLMAFEQSGDGVDDIVIVQGVEMGRPSRIALQLTVAGGALDHIEIGGHAHILSEGRLRL